MSVNNFLRAQIVRLEKQMRDLADKTVSSALGQVDYLIVVGKYRGLKSTRDQYEDMLKRSAEEADTPDLDEEGEEDPAPPRATPGPVRKPARPMQRPRSWGGR